MIPARGPQTMFLSNLQVRYLCKAVHGHESIITWSFRARQEDKGTGAHNMGTCPLARLSPTCLELPRVAPRFHSQDCITYIAQTGSHSLDCIA